MQLLNELVEVASGKPKTFYGVELWKELIEFFEVFILEGES
jgi:hypothetical protein